MEYKKISKAEHIRNALTENPDATLVSIASKVNCDLSYVWSIRRKLRKEGRIPGGAVLSPFKSVPYPALRVRPAPVETVVRPAPTKEVATPQHDEVNHPAHYTSGGIETIDFIEAKLSPEEFRGYCLGNALKYLSRTGKKGEAMTDLQKAKWYLARVTPKG